MATVLNGVTAKNLSFTYNSNGDRTSEHDSIAGTTQTLGYDQADRPTSYAAGSTSVTYTYNGDGLRTNKMVNGVAQPEVWDLAEGMPLLLAGGTNSYVTGLDGLPIEQIIGRADQRGDSSL